MFELTDLKGNTDLKLLGNLSQREVWTEIRENLLSFLLASACSEITIIFARSGDPEGGKLFPPLYLFLKNLDNAKSDQIRLVSFLYYTLKLLELSGHSIISSTYALPEVEELWFKEMLQRKTAFVPENKELVRDAVRLITEFLELEVGHKITSLDEVLIKSESIFSEARS